MTYDPYKQIEERRKVPTITCEENLSEKISLIDKAIEIITSHPYNTSVENMVISDVVDDLNQIKELL